MAFSDVADELLKLKQLLDSGILTQEEFDMLKSKVLNTDNALPQVSTQGNEQLKEWIEWFKATNHRMPTKEEATSKYNELNGLQHSKETQGEPTELLRSSNNLQPDHSQKKKENLGISLSAFTDSVIGLMLMLTGLVSSIFYMTLNWPFWIGLNALILSIPALIVNRNAKKGFAVAALLISVVTILGAIAIHVQIVKNIQNYDKQIEKQYNLPSNF
ncbi:MAG: SHOCT domain-containing protein [Streptococcaceae bacterium]|jgi:hypothetical protein|nr:SHOCT domain-containing protein [Streptococcaceae bacterium]